MNKLYVDDIRTPKDNSWTIARTVTSAISAISEDWFNVISLDYDISHQVVMGGVSRPYPCEETFEPVAAFIVERYHDVYSYEGLRPKIIIHTANPVGRLKLKEILGGFEIEEVFSEPANRLETHI